MRKLTVLLICCLLICIITPQANAAISQSVTYNVRPSGSATNGGGFVQGATGTDWSLFDNANSAGCSNCGSATNDQSSVLGVANGTTTFTCADCNFQTSIVGNVIYLSGGTGVIAATRREVTARASTTSITIDASVAASTGMTVNIGGALDLPQTALALITRTGQQVYVMLGTYAVGATITFPNVDNTSPSANSNPYMRFIGYSSTYGDCTVGSCAGGRPTLQATANSVTVIDGGCNCAGWFLENFIIDLNAHTGVTGMNMRQFWTASNIKIMGGDGNTSQALKMGSNTYNVFQDGEITGFTDFSGNGLVQMNNTGGGFFRNSVHGNVSTQTAGVVDVSGAGVIVAFNLLYANTASGGGHVDGIKVHGSVNQYVLNNTVDGTDRDGITVDWGGPVVVKNNLLTNNGAYGLAANVGTTNAFRADSTIDGNAYYNNTTNKRLNVDDTGTTFPGNAAAAYTNVYDVTLSGDPYTNRAGGNFTLSGTGGGARGTGQPSIIGGVGHTGTSYPTFGVFTPDPNVAASGNVGTVH